MEETDILERPKEFVDALSYPGKKQRPLAKRPVSVPYDPYITDFTPIKAKKYDTQHFTFSLFFTAFDVRDYGPEIKKFMKIYSNINIGRIYLETYRDGYEADYSLLKSVKDTLIKEGFKVSSAVTTTHFSDKTKYNEIESAAGCYTDKEALKKMRAVFERTAQVFDEIIIDDWFFTMCRCPSCMKAKGERPFDRFRMKLMSDVAKKYIVEPAKKANKKVKLIIKYPQWLEDLHEKGYDIIKLSEMFDEVAVGTETRDFNTGRYMPIHGSMLFRYFKELFPEKTKRAWFDPYACDTKLFTEQAYQSVIGGATELILFCAGILAQKNMRPLMEALSEMAPKLDRFSSMKKIFNIPVIKKPSTTGDIMLTQYIMMAGVPAYITPLVPAKEKFIVLTAQSCEPSGRAVLFAELLKKKKDMLITTEFAAPLKKYFNIKPLKKKIKDGRVFVLNMPQPAGTITNVTGNQESADYRYLLKSSGMMDAFKAVFKNYCVFALYERVKTYYKYDI